jgi:PAS domain S-box-containing protein
MKFCLQKQRACKAAKILQIKQYVRKRLRYFTSAAKTMSAEKISTSLQLPWAVFQLDLSGKLTNASSKARELMQFWRTKNLKTVLDQVHWKANLSWNELFENELAQVGYYKFYDSKSVIHWYRFSLDFQDQCSFLNVEEVTGEKLSNDLSTLACESASVGSWELDLLRNQLFWSDSVRKIHEVPMDYQPQLDTAIDFYKTGYSRDKIREVVSECIDKGTHYSVDLIIVTATGKEKWVRAKGHSEIVNGKCTRMYGTFQDIDQQKRSEIKNHRLSERMQVAVQSAKVGLWDLDIVNNVVHWDDIMYEMYGVQRSEFSGDFDAWEKTVHPDDKEEALRNVEKAIAGEQDFNTVFRIISGSGDIRYITGKAEVFRDTNGNPIRMIGANTDITKIKRNETRLRKLLDITEKQNQSLLNFAHIVSHNLRSNSSNLSLLTGMFKTGKMPVDRAVEMIQVSADRLEQTVADLNEVVQIKTKDEQHINIPVKQVLLDVLEGINGTWVSANAKLDLELDANLMVKGVKAYVESVIHNMLTNALKYSKKDKALRLSVYAETTFEDARIYFKDNGQGIDLKKHKDKIFGMYKTFHGNKDAKGIGLFLSQNQMESMGGKITVESTPKHGTTFCLHFKKEA